MRLFAAVELSDEMKTSVASAMHELKVQGVRGSYVPKQNLHLTLAFIGEVENPAPVKDALRTVSMKPFRLSLSEMGTFGDLLWVGFKGNQGLGALVKDVRAALDQAGISYDRKKFTPHVTIIRKMAGNWKSVPAPKGDMTVKAFSLMKSAEKDGKRVYTEILRIS